MASRYLAVKITLLAAFFAVILLTACQQVVPLPPSSARLTIGDIKETPAAYEGKVVTIEGKYQGWDSGFGNPSVTRSDWVLQDTTGWLYVTGKPSGLDPLGDTGHPIRVVGVVKITGDGELYLSAQEVEIKASKASALLLIQIDLRQKQITNPMPERLEQMKAMGMRIDNLGIQRTYIHFAQEPTVEQIDELKVIGVMPYPDSWIPSAGGHTSGFMVAEIPIDKLDELANMDYVVRLDTAEQALEPHAE